jgi:hypothetical protein
VLPKTLRKFSGEKPETFRRPAGRRIGNVRREVNEMSHSGEQSVARILAQRDRRGQQKLHATAALERRLVEGGEASDEKKGGDHLRAGTAAGCWATQNFHHGVVPRLRRTRGHGDAGRGGKADGCNSPNIYRLVEAGRLHFSEVPGSGLLVCVESLKELSQDSTDRVSREGTKGADT